MSRGAATVGLISNPASGHNRDQFERIRSRIAHTREIHHIVTNSSSDIPLALEEMASRKVRVLAINGGDGTCSAILGHMLETGVFPELPLIALLPGGTANMNAGDVGIKGSLVRATDRFCEWCERGQNKDTAREWRALLRVVVGGGRPAVYGMFFGAGAVIQGTDYAHKEIHSRGLRDDFSLALGTLRTAWGLLRNDPDFRSSVAVKLSVDGGESQRHDMLILAASTLHRLAFGMRPFWGEGDGAVRFTLIEQDCSRFARTFLSILRGRANPNAIPAEGYISGNAQSICLDLAGKFNLDGEIFETDCPVELSASAPLEFLRL